MAGKLYGIGVGPGDPELMTLKAVRLIKECDVIGIPGENPKESVAYAIAKGAWRKIEDKEHLLLTTPMTKDREILERGYAAAATNVEKKLQEGKNVAVLTLGDPTIYSTYIYIHRLVTSHGFEAEIVSGIPSFCAVAARLGDSLVDRNMQLHVIPTSYQIDDALELEGTKIFMKAASKFSCLKDKLLKKDCKSQMIENCGMENEKLYLDKKTYPDEASYYTIVVVKDEI